MFLYQMCGVVACFIFYVLNNKMPSTKCGVLGCTSKEKKHVFPNTDGDYKIGWSVVTTKNFLKWINL